MKLSLGKFLFVWILFVSHGWGAYQWRVLEAPASLLVGESGVVRYECVFDTSAADYTIDFKPAQSEGYKAAILTQRDQIKGGKRVQTYDVLITPKQAGKIDVNLEALIRHTTFASIENATIGRDNVKKYDFDDAQVMLPSVKIDVNENTAGLIGNLTLEVHTDAKAVRAHEPLHLSIIVQGSGNLDRLIPYELNISGVKVFSQPPQKSLTASKDGFEGEVIQEFALVSRESYTIEPFSLRYFDTDKKRIVTLKSKSLYVEVGEGYEPSSLLDTPELSDWSTLARYSLYSALVIAGVVLGEGARRLWRLRPRRKAKQFWDEAKSSKELVILLSLAG
ncbi:MAG: hypothetical protein Q7T91_02000, partial [Sulfuricurvum sp.]|nr:hypothetical protein [Sulfuricurvum sp.]